MKNHHNSSNNSSLGNSKFLVAHTEAAFGELLKCFSWSLAMRRVLAIAGHVHGNAEAETAVSRVFQYVSASAFLFQRAKAV